MCSSLTMNTDGNDNNDIAPDAARRVLMDENPDNEPQLSNEHEHPLVGHNHVCLCYVSACSGPR